METFQAGSYEGTDEGGPGGAGRRARVPGRALRGRSRLAPAAPAAHPAQAGRGHHAAHRRYRPDQLPVGGG